MKPSKNIVRIQKWLGDKTTYNFNTINIIRPDQAQQIDKQHFIGVLNDAALAISASWGKKGFDGLIFHVCCYAAPNRGHFVFTFLVSFVSKKKSGIPGDIFVLLLYFVCTHNQTPYKRFYNKTNS